MFNAATAGCSNSGGGSSGHYPYHHVHHLGHHPPPHHPHHHGGSGGSGMSSHHTSRAPTPQIPASPQRDGSTTNNYSISKIKVEGQSGNPNLENSPRIINTIEVSVIEKARSLLTVFIFIIIIILLISFIIYIGMGGLHTT